jgi:hypothetical protein
VLQKGSGDFLTNDGSGDVMPHSQRNPFEMAFCTFQHHSAAVV